MDRSRTLAQNLSYLDEPRRHNRQRSRKLASDRTLQVLADELLAARTGACLTQAELAARMGTTKSAVARLERGTGMSPTLRTITRYALAVGASVEIRVR
ncbi:MAG TPA: helix-turn-helix transcriptional regulator [Casimicrobiaceae bacterium]|nr:helix-turn-helix transcriptional regulator [Casimicrobiaceae bacterium]